MNDSVAKKKKEEAKEPEEGFGVVRHTATRTEVLTSPDAGMTELTGQGRDPSLVVVQGDLMGRVFRLRQGRTVIGRHPDSDILIQQRVVSGLHAEIRSTDLEIVLEDLKSSNGTFLNNERIEKPTILKPDDLVKIGTSVFRYVENKVEVDFTESLHDQTTRDSMTGVFNKGYLLKQLASSIEIAKSGFPLSLVIFDLDHFKKVNDTYGHLAGDYVLIETCRLLKNAGLRSDAVLARYGGEEFVALLSETGLKVAVGVAERMRKTIEEHAFVYEGKKIPVTSSLGVVAWTPAMTTPEQMIGAADELLYRSKQAGRNRVTAMSDPSG